MKANFTSEDEKEIKRIVKSTDMALFIWELVHNGWRQLEGHEQAWAKIHELLDQYGIDIDDLIE